jgi:uncharacterized protein (DUF983 family)
MSEMAVETKHVPALKAVVMGRCPVCREGAIFTGPWNRVNFLETRKNCPVCNTQYEAEPGFFTGAMYVSYAFNVATFVAVSLFLFVIFHPSSPWVYIFSIIGTTVAIIPFTSRASRVIWMYLFGPFKYDRSRSGLPNH